MSVFSPRPLRIDTECRLEIRLQESGRDDFLPGRCEGNLINVSREGACIILSQMLLEGRHIFFSTLGREDQHLVIFIKNLRTEQACFEIHARSVWMDSCWYKDEPAFKMGVRFKQREKQLFKHFKDRL